ncbi:MAG: hypothetical protein ACPGSD_12135 [Flavobacteriales bacterium]
MGAEELKKESKSSINTPINWVNMNGLNINQIAELRRKFDTIETDRHGGKYIRLPIDGYHEISSIRDGLIDCIQVISRGMFDENIEIRNVANQLNVISKLLGTFLLYQEMEGIDLFMKMTAHPDPRKIE